MENKIVKSKQGVVSLKKYTKFEPVLLPIIQTLVSMGYSDADVGIMVGYSGKDARNWLKGLKERNDDVRAICEVGKHQANLRLVSRAFQLATEGYDYVETVDKFPVIINVDGTESAVGKFERQIKKKHIKADTNLLWNLLCSRLPEYFGHVKKDKPKSFDGDVEGEITAFFGKLSKIKPKHIESVEV